MASVSPVITPTLATGERLRGSRLSAGGFMGAGEVLVWSSTVIGKPATETSAFLETPLAVPAVLSAVACAWPTTSPARFPPSRFADSEATSACAWASYGAGSGSACAGCWRSMTE
ncbi:hypothetical protein ASH02_05500 [Nocardioides sp. Soil796]|nr:hypothetical protein ASH02_05500 [Nocardioides sp. Soil796]